MNTTTLRELHTGLVLRRTPEQVCAAIVDLGLHEHLDTGIRHTIALMKASQAHRFTSMPATYRAHPGLGRAYTAAARAMHRVVSAVTPGAAVPLANSQDPGSLTQWVAWANELLGLGDGGDNPAKRRKIARVRTHSYEYKDWTSDTILTETWTSRDGSRGRRGDTHGHADPRTKMTAEQRRAALPGVSVRAYRRAVAAVNHLEQRTGVLAAERDREACVAFGKARLAHTLRYQDFAEDPATAVFVAYYVARLGMRTVFTNGAQDRPMDEIADALLTQALASPTSRPDVIATVLTRQSVLNRLSDEQKGALLGAYYAQLTTISRALARAFDGKRDRTRMVARPGDDSSTWNAASRAFNQARTGWLNLTRALGMDWVVEGNLPGKVPALVAADVAHWHQLSGNDAHKDVAVFAELPLPWEVILDAVPCPADLVRATCAKHDVNADTSGWTQAYRQDGLEQAAPTPELVHGVVVACPELAQLLRRHRVMAGRVDLSDVRVEASTS